MIPVGKPGEKPRHRASLVNNEETHREQNRRKHWNIWAKQQTWERSEKSWLWETIGNWIGKAQKTYGKYWKMVEFADLEQPQVGQAAQSRMKLPFDYLT